MEIIRVIYLVGLLWGLNVLVTCVRIRLCMAQSKYLVIVSCYYYYFASSLYRRESWTQGGKAMYPKLPGLRAPVPWLPGQVDLTPHGQLQLPANFQENVPRFLVISITAPGACTEFNSSHLEVGADYLPNSIKEWIQLWMFLSYLKCPQSRPGWLKM